MRVALFSPVVISGQPSAPSPRSAKPRNPRSRATREPANFFRGVQVQRWNREQAERERLMGGGWQDVMRQMRQRPEARELFVQCPMCRVHNVKDGRNNHMYCDSCRMPFCFMCRRPVRNFAAHYGKGKPCKQHS